MKFFSRLFSVADKTIISVARFVQNLPLLKALFMAKMGEYKEAGIEFGIVWVFSVVPIGFSIIVDYFTRASIKSGELKSETVDLTGIWDRVLLNLNGGEVFIYIISFLGTVAFVMYKYNRSGKPFEDFWPVVLLGGGMALVSVLIFGLQRSRVIERYDLVNNSAAAMYCVTLCLFFVALLYEQRRTRPYAGELKKAEADLVAEMSTYKPT